MPLGNYTSQFLANVYLGKFDHFVKHALRTKFYIRYVDDFIILHRSRKQLHLWKEQLENFLRNELKLTLHPQKSRIIPLSKCVDFVGFRNSGRYKLLRKRSTRKMKRKINLYEKGEITFSKLTESYRGWQAYARWANTHNLRKNVKNKLIDALLKKI